VVFQCRNENTTDHNPSRSGIFWHSTIAGFCTNLQVIILKTKFSFHINYVLFFFIRENRVRNKLPIQFIMGIATTVALQQQLHHRTSVCIATKSFQSRPSVVLLNHLIEQLFMKSSILKLGPRLMQLLLDGFLYHDLSLNSFMMRVHLIIMQHYITLPVSSLCCSVSELKVQ
jgi:origin recognition complex subunit 3